MRDYLNSFLEPINQTQSSEIHAGNEIPKVSKPTFEPFDTSHVACIPENVLLFRTRIDREPDWLREHTDEIEERAAIMEYDGGLLRERAETKALDWGRAWFAPVPF